MSKKIECWIFRWAGKPDYYRIHLGDLEIVSYGTKLRKLFPALLKGLGPGQSRKLVLTQTAKGIRLERADK